jgi:hypothetical protein
VGRSHSARGRGASRPRRAETRALALARRRRRPAPPPRRRTERGKKRIWRERGARGARSVAVEVAGEGTVTDTVREAHAESSSRWRWVDETRRRRAGTVRFFTKKTFLEKKEKNFKNFARPAVENVQRFCVRVRANNVEIHPRWRLFSPPCLPLPSARHTSPRDSRGRPCKPTRTSTRGPVSPPVLPPGAFVRLAVAPRVLCPVFVERRIPTHGEKPFACVAAHASRP